MEIKTAVVATLLCGNTDKDKQHMSSLRWTLKSEVSEQTKQKQTNEQIEYIYIKTHIHIKTWVLLKSIHLQLVDKCLKI